ncbi:hypothetical protein M4I32_13160 [Microbacterium sp. LRZ72]|uniref:hypothetical protein n=1 Tax=Microbacterium sp. LRZ72 TaxID=2942481 RepID=UPI0029B3376A|nr:hypothetical protein [Microbacterium sp. LRZ72]MDX2377750.1 hypothetical protein [Microbacterium sp. LRZ72]
MKIDVRTLEGEPITWRDATVPIGSALRIAPAFRATVQESDVPYDTTVQAHWDPELGRYRVTSVNVVVAEPAGEINGAALRRVRMQEIVQAATPSCIAVSFDDGNDPSTVSELTTTEGRLVPTWMAAEARKRENKDARMDLVELIYSAAALAGQPPTKAVQAELDVPYRTAADWIAKARAAGRLEGMSYIAGRQADG